MKSKTIRLSPEAIHLAEQLAALKGTTAGALIVKLSGYRSRRTK